MWSRILFISFLFLPDLVFSQQTFLPLNRYIHNLYEDSLNRLDVSFHTAVKPYLQSETDSIIAQDSLYPFDPYQTGSSKAGKILGGFLNNHLVSIKSGDFQLTADPLLNVEAGIDYKTKEKAFVNTRGFQLAGSIGKKFSFYSSFYENQATFVRYLDSFITDTKIIPGQGEQKPFKNTGYDYSMATGYISFTPSRYFNFQFGNGKNFIGDGYRSLLLSDNAFNYPFFKITTTIWKIKYVNLYAQFQDIRPSNVSVLGKGYPKKFGTFHFLSWNVSRRLNLGFFESIIWQGSDSTHYRGFDFNYLNPVIFFRPVEFSLGSADNALIGLNGKFKISNSGYLFGQFILDDFKFSELKNKNSGYHQKYGYQIGLKFRNILLTNLNFHTEYNYVMPYTYSHRLSAQNYGHYNASLAHPLGANFKESVSFISYQKRRWLIETKFIYTIYGADSAGIDFGKNIYASEYNISTSPKNPENKVGQGLKTNLMYAGLKLAYIVNPKTNLRIELNYLYRHLFNSVESQNTNFISFGIKTSLQNFYYDF